PTLAKRSVWYSRRVPPRCHRAEPPKAGKAGPAARPDAGLIANKLPRAWLLAPPRTAKAPTSSTQSAQSGRSQRSCLCSVRNDRTSRPNLEVRARDLDEWACVPEKRAVNVDA